MELLRDLYNACDPRKPAVPAFYVDCSEARGAGALTPEFERRLGLENDWLRFLFAGHPGCGKSSEVAQLCNALNDPKRERRCYAAWLELRHYVALDDCDAVDIVLAVMAALAEAVRRDLKIELSESAFGKRLRKVKEILLAEIEIGGKIQAGGMFGKVEADLVRSTPELRQKMRNALRPQVGTLVDETNAVLCELRERLADKARNDLVILVDDLDKIGQFAGHEDQMSSWRELFLAQAPLLTRIDAHVLLSLPLPVARSMGPQLAQLYGQEPHVLPMVKTADRGSDAPFEPGLDCLKAIVAKRAEPVPLQQTIEPDALGFLLDCCGGHIRQLMSFIREACVHAKAQPIDLAAAHQAIAKTVRSYSTAIGEQHWPKLVSLYESEDQRIPSSDPDYLAMLENLYVLEYVNGGDTASDPFRAPEPWYAVHPVIRRLERFEKLAGKNSSDEHG